MEEKPLRAHGESLFAHEPDRRWKLARRLEEISGLAVTPDGRLIGHDDELAKIYELDIETGQIVKTFAVGDRTVKGDFEGIATNDKGEVFLITSCGRLYRFAEGAHGERVGFEVYETGLGEIGEVEGLAFDAGDNNVLITCKTVHARELTGNITIFAWSVARQKLYPAPWLAVRATEVSEAIGVRDFHPSGVEIDPATGRLVLLASRQRALAELDAKGGLIAARRLSKFHRQAEGVTIMPDGALVIADEGQGGRARLSRYPRAR